MNINGYKIYMIEKEIIRNRDSFIETLIFI